MDSKLKSLRKTLLRTVTATLGVVICSTVLAPVASAQCGYFDGHKAPTSIWQQVRQGQAKLRPTSFLLASEDGQNSDNMSIVGFWKVKFVAEGNAEIPDGTVIDFGLAQWHSDGTEIMNSGLRDPRSGNFCMGVWKKTRASTYQLNHFGLSWDTNGNFIGPAQIGENVTVHHGGNTFVGPFTIDQFDTSGKILAHIVGEITGIRITVNTSVQDLF